MKANGYEVTDTAIEEERLRFDHHHTGSIMKSERSSSVDMAAVLRLTVATVKSSGTR